MVLKILSSGVQFRLLPVPWIWVKALSLRFLNHKMGIVISPQSEITHLGRLAAASWPVENVWIVEIQKFKNLEIFRSSGTFLDSTNHASWKSYAVIYASHPVLHCDCAGDEKVWHSFTNIYLAFIVCQAFCKVLTRDIKMNKTRTR